MSSKRVTILGSTGSIGQSTLDVIARNPEQYSVFALVAGRNLEQMVSDCVRHRPRFATLSCPDANRQLGERLSSLGIATQVVDYEQDMTMLCQHSDVDMVMSAIVGAAGLIPTLYAIEAAKVVMLANKESLVMSGQLFMDKVRHHGATLLPIDSEHNAIFQCMPEAIQGHHDATLVSHGVSKILLTGSGGPFRERALDTFADITVAEAVAHPNWSMGQKISVDSATMMNKGLEFIEAKWLFNASADDIEVVIHPQSMIHSMVQYCDGSVLAQMGQPDMRTPIAHALAYPQRIDAGVAPLDFSAMKDFSFHAPDFNRYPNLRLAIEACKAGQSATTIINAANEEAVAAFLAGRIRFTDIYAVNADTLAAMSTQYDDCLEGILRCDGDARCVAQQQIKSRAK
ncbi:1-deoxy-D-xylulose-5-phosphate reductoisomerase [Pseudoalteromonas sp. BDTF-M6]|uniref:1-deoxy-D-xylulose-5-phosphate reductoisomerase n=1 Tax=Pseudoalteromonas sp. BDTF-M6 TaxID=2796132 RepID=UPI001BB0748F|nr:1-deoxy-D-xylulose-5-phosphate reductoisomerase [Pseudoalteromonas sp. BDTF-M6]MBS3798659.1 1-deoxy-D-xylulose-5-phosphate reductoisomerase [Pseudoalteromonas sp. BDTF-M6]